MDIKLKNNKTSIIIIAIMTLLIASIGMVLSYHKIKSDSKKFSYNVYEESNNFSNIIKTSTYGLYYKLYDENNENRVRPADLMLELKPGIDTTYTQDKMYVRDGFDDNIEEFNTKLSNLRNLEYYVLDKEHNLVKKNMNNNLELLAKNNKNNKEINKLKDKYNFYIVLDFDDKGNMNIENIYGATKEEMQSNLNMQESEDIFVYEMSNDYELKPIKNMKYVYAVPKDLKYTDMIYYNTQRVENNAYKSASQLFINIAVAFVVLVAIILPYKELKDIELFKKIFKIPAEIVVILAYMAFVYMYLGSSELIIKTANNIPVINFEQLQLTQDVSNIVNYLINIIFWLILFAIIFMAIIVLKYILDVKPKNYLREHSLTYKGLRFIKRKFINFYKWAFGVELGRKNKKKIITILIINSIVVALMCLMWFFALIVIPIYTIVLYIIIKKKFASVNNDYNKLLDLTKDIASGNLEANTEEDLGTFNVLKDEVKSIQAGFKKAVDEEVKSQKMKTELISNVSHDLKTPLTSIITYTDLLKDENLSDEKRREYINTLDRKSERLRVLIEDLFEVSKANSGNVSLNIIDVDIVSLMKQTLLEVDDKMKASNLTIRSNFPEEKVILKLDSQRTFRVFENLLINITKYSMNSSRVYIDILDNDYSVNISFKNMTAEEIDFNVDELVERFVRGDKSRNTDGSGLGLAIAKSFVELQGGSFDVSTDGDLFKVVIVFKK